MVSVCLEGKVCADNMTKTGVAKWNNTIQDRMNRMLRPERCLAINISISIVI